MTNANNTIVLTKTLYTGNNNYGYSGSTSVDIYCTKVTHKITSGLQKEIQNPTLPSDTASVPVNYIVDLRKSVESWVIDGYLEDDVAGDTAMTKSNKIVAMRQAGGTLDTFVYTSQGTTTTISTGAYIYSYSADDIDLDYGDAIRGGEAKFKVSMEIRRGVVIGT